MSKTNPWHCQNIWIIYYSDVRRTHTMHNAEMKAKEWAKERRANIACMCCTYLSSFCMKKYRHTTSKFVADKNQLILFRLVLLEFTPFRIPSKNRCSNVLTAKLAQWFSAKLYRHIRGNRPFIECTRSHARVHNSFHLINCNLPIHKWINYSIGKLFMWFQWFGDIEMLSCLK